MVLMQLDVNLKFYYTITAFSKGWLRRKLWVCLECREENRPFSGQQHQAQFGLNPALNLMCISKLKLEALLLLIGRRSDGVSKRFNI